MTERTNYHLPLDFLSYFTLSQDSPEEERKLISRRAVHVTESEERKSSSLALPTDVTHGTATGKSLLHGPHGTVFSCNP